MDRERKGGGSRIHDHTQKRISKEKERYIGRKERR